MIAIAERRIESAQIVALEGELDAASSAQTRTELRERLKKGQIRFVIDLSAVPFLDSSGLSVLVTVLKAAREQGGDIALLSPVPQVRSLLELTRLHRVFEVFEHEDDAVAAFGAYR